MVSVQWEMEPCIIECAQGGGTKKGSLDTKGFPDKKIEQVMGIEPTYLAWKASVLPLNYTCMKSIYLIIIGVTGFEPATSWSQTRRSSQAEPHPGISYVPVSPVAQCLLYYKVFRLSIFFLHFFIFLMTFYFILFLHAISRLLLCRTFRQSKYF